MSEEKEFDVVLHALQQHRNRLWKMTQQNMTSEFIGMNIMDDIRLQQIDELDEAIKERATPPQRTWVGLTDEDKEEIKKQANYHWEMTTGEYAQIVQNLTEVKLKQKNEQQTQ